MNRPASLNLSAASSYFSLFEPNEKNPPFEAPESLEFASAKSLSAEPAITKMCKDREGHGRRSFTALLHSQIRANAELSGFN
jgi:hypothetical protein